MSKLQLLRLKEVVDKVPRYQASEENDLQSIIKDQLLLGSDKKTNPQQGMPTLNPDFKSEAYESEDDYEQTGYGTDSENAGFRLRKDEDYDRDQEWKR